MTTPHSTPSVPAASTSGGSGQERADLLDVLRKHRGLFRLTVAGLTDEQARATALDIWSAVNGPNLRDNIAPTRSRARLVLQKAADHRTWRTPTLV